MLDRASQSHRRRKFRSNRPLIKSMLLPPTLLHTQYPLPALHPYSIWQRRAAPSPRHSVVTELPAQKGSHHAPESEESFLPSARLL